MDKKQKNNVVRLDTGFFPIPNAVKQRMIEQRKDMDKKATSEFIEHYINGTRDDLIESFSANGIDIFSDDGINDLSFLVEAHNAFLHRRLGLKHFMDNYIDSVINVTTDNEEKREE